ncbi:hypothetical protein OXX79_001616 [Metschnikowia pulcherrima]
MRKFFVLVTVLTFVSTLTAGHNVRNSTLAKPNDTNLNHRVCHYCTSNPSRDQDDARSLLNIFIKQLKRFIIETQFKYAQFEAHKKGLKQFLTTIRIHVETLDPYNSDIMDQLLFAERMFEAMTMATENASKLDYWGTTDDYLAISMIELNVALFALRNFDSVLKKSPHWNIQMLYMFGMQIQQWKREFGKLKIYSKEAYKVFENERIKAENMIYVMWGQV